MFVFFKKNWILIIILILGAFLRLYRIEDYMTFLGDEGRDVILVRNLLVKFDPILIGPGTSVGNMYLGPFYYYFMAPFLLLFNFSPVGPAIGVAVLGVSTIYLVFVVAKNWFGYTAGYVSAILFAISPTVINFSHSSWNPNIMPFFTLLSIYSIWLVYNQKKYLWLIVSAASFAIVLQSHYLGSLIFPVLIFYLFLSVKKYKFEKELIKKLYLSILVFFIIMSPLFLFDLRHEFINSRALFDFIRNPQETVLQNHQSPLTRIYSVFEQVNGSMLVAKNEKLGKVISILFLLLTVFFISKSNNTIKFNSTFKFLTIWFFSGLLGFLIYRQNIIDHYFGFLFPVPFLMFGAFFNYFWINNKFVIRLFLVIALFCIVFVNLINNPFVKNPNNQMRRAKNVSEAVLSIVSGKPFNLAVLADRNYEDGYRYFMELNGAQVMHADRWDQKTIVDTLIVICEKPEKECDPTHSPKAEVANFGMSKIENNWEVDGVIIYKLVHSK